MYYEQGLLNEAIQTYQEAISREANFPEAYNNLGNALREANRMEEAMQCYTMCIQLQLRTPRSGQAGGAASISPPAAAFQQAQRLSVAYNNLGGILKMQVCQCLLYALLAICHLQVTAFASRIAFLLVAAGSYDLLYIPVQNLL